MITAKEIAGAIEEFAPLSTQAEWDNSGFQVGSRNAVVTKALVALNCSLEVVREALDKGCDMLLTHHPLIVHKPCLNILEGDPRSDTIIAAIRGGLTVYSSHTPLDRAVGGLNTLMAEKLRLSDLEPLGDDGFGFVGSLPQPIDAQAFTAEVKAAFKAKAVRSSAPLKTCVKRVAVSSGGGQGSIAAAVAQGAQVLVTGDVTHHNFYVPEGFMVIDIGHHESELAAIDLLTALVKKKFCKFALLQSTEDKSPIYYY